MVDQDEHTVSFMDINPWTRGHALVIPRTHSRNLLRLDPPATSPAQWRPARSGSPSTCARRLGCDGINLLNSSEPAAWQTVFHFHMHVIPRYDDDPLRLPGQPREPEEGELAEVAAKLRGGD